MIGNNLSEKFRNIIYIGLFLRQASPIMTGTNVMSSEWSDFSDDKEIPIREVPHKKIIKKFQEELMMLDALLKEFRWYSKGDTDGRLLTELEDDHLVNCMRLSERRGNDAVVELMRYELLKRGVNYE
jgi:hypothetical protein